MNTDEHMEVSWFLTAFASVRTCTLPLSPLHILHGMNVSTMYIRIYMKVRYLSTGCTAARSHPLAELLRKGGICAYIRMHRIYCNHVQICEATLSIDCFNHNYDRTLCLYMHYIHIYVYVYMYIYMYIYICTWCMYKHTNTHTHTQTHVYKHTYVRTCAHLCPYVCCMSNDDFFHCS